MKKIYYFVALTMSFLYGIHMMGSGISYLVQYIATSSGSNLSDFILYIIISFLLFAASGTSLMMHIRNKEKGVSSLWPCIILLISASIVLFGVQTINGIRMSEYISSNNQVIKTYQEMVNPPEEIIKQLRGNNAAMIVSFVFSLSEAFLFMGFSILTFITHRKEGKCNEE